ncbi:MAG TPA: helix-turn-helix domain-containing protein [Frankiaceae bacterium]|nr:helix-turn-helix domain-containing protein [Frankiaceae bacterium]
MHLYERVRNRVPVLSRRMVEAFAKEVPFYERLPREQLDGEIAQLCADNLRTFFATLIEDRKPTPEEHAEPRLSAARRAQERVPLDAVLTAYHLGARMAWQELCAQARPDETDDLLRAADSVQRWVQAVTATVATAYLEEQQAIHGEERDARRALVTALLNGEPADALAARLAVSLAGPWTVLAVDVGPHEDERAGGVTGAVAGSRKVRRVTAALGEGTLGALDATGGVVLVPGVDAALVAALGEAAGAPVWAAYAPAADARAVAAAGEQAREVLRLARSRPPGLYGLRDVLLDYQLTRPSDALPVLASLLDPLSAELRRTVESYLENDLDRRRTAAALHVHPNTLDYRLRRVVELTGLDPSTTNGLALLVAATVSRAAAR